MSLSESYINSPAVKLRTIESYIDSENREIEQLKDILNSNLLKLAEREQSRSKKDLLTSLKPKLMDAQKMLEDFLAENEPVRNREVVVKELRSAVDGNDSKLNNSLLERSQFALLILQSRAKDLKRIGDVLMELNAELYKS